MNFHVRFFFFNIIIFFLIFLMFRSIISSTKRVSASLQVPSYRASPAVFSMKSSFSSFSFFSKDEKKEEKVEEKVESCSSPSSSEIDEEDLEEMFIQGPAGMEWGGPTRGGRRPEPTRYGDWERQGRASDFQ